jgi:putative methyltransferase (TIGR04325 family)
MANLQASDARSLILLRAAQKGWRCTVRGIGFHTFEGNYPSLVEVPCGKDSYDDDNLAQLIAGARLENLKSAGATKKITDSTGTLILPLVVSQLLAEPLTVLDFGGGAGVGMVSILDHVSRLDLSKFSYVIVETPAMCRAVRDKIGPILKAKLGTSSFVEVVEDIPASIAGPLIVNMGSAIQYISPYRETLSRLAIFHQNFLSYRKRLCRIPQPMRGNSSICRIKGLQVGYLIALILFL